MRTDAQMATIITRATKDLHHDLAKKWGFPIRVFAGSTFGLGVTMMLESGYSEEEIFQIARDLVEGLSAPPDARGAS